MAWYREPISESIRRSIEIEWDRRHETKSPPVRLASDGTWGALRFALNPPGAPDQDLFAELLGDPRLTTLTTTRLEEAIVNQ